VNIQAVATRTGVPAATLRKWEQRYGVLAPDRTEGSHRRYSEADVLRIEWLKERLADGYRIGEAARLLGAGDGEAPAAAPEELAHELVEATAASDPARVERLVEQALALLEPGQAIESVLGPGLVEIGGCWARGEVGVGQEHATSEVVRARLRALVDPRATGTRGRAVLCCVAGERHEIGLLAVAVLLQGAGWGTVYLGADTPLPEAVAVAIARDASLLCVSATDERLAAGAEPELQEISTENGFRVLRGGQGFGGEPASTAVRSLDPPVVA
jgi:methanogenic corrinoid protein MtbC1